MDFKPRQIYSVIFQKEYYPCNRFEIGIILVKKYIFVTVLKQ